MSGSFGFAIDFLHELAIVAGLSWGYGLLRQRRAGAFWAPVVLGALFGCVAVLQMSAPLEPVDGMIIDLRCVPIVLAGAFLGWRGALVCIAIAIPARIGFGGVGMMAGVAAVMLAAAGGLIWSYATRHLSRRGFEQFFHLALATCLSLIGGLFLPTELAAWFYRELALPLVATYLVTVPLVAALLERERMLQDGGRATALQEEIDPETGLRGQLGFARDVAHATASGTQAPLVGAIILTIRDRNFLTHHWGKSAMGHVLGGLRHRFTDMVPSDGVFGLKNDGSLLIAVNAQRWAQLDDIRSSLHRAAADGVMSLPNGESTRIAISTRITRFSDPASARSVIEDLEAPFVPQAPTTTVSDKGGSAFPPVSSGARPEQSNGTNRQLFAQAEALLQARGT